jgi:hypothetical protein
VKYDVFWNVTPCGSCKNLPILCRMRRLLVTASVVRSSPNLVGLVIAIRSSETSVLTTATQR